VFRGSGTRENSVLGSRVLDSQYPKVRNHEDRQIKGRLIAVDPVGDIILEFRGLWRLGHQKLYIRTRELAKSETMKRGKKF
jgi:hypothetical protein